MRIRRRTRRRVRGATAVTTLRSLLFIALLVTAAAAPALAADALRERLPQDEVIYFVLPDRFENGDTSNDRGANDRGQPDRGRRRDDRLVHGFDPTSKAFYHGGDLRGLTERLDYIQALGATAVWLTPVFKNKPVQGGPGMESAG